MAHVLDDATRPEVLRRYHAGTGGDQRWVMTSIIMSLQVGQEGYMRSRARRSARVVDDATRTEVLRRFLLPVV